MGKSCWVENGCKKTLGRGSVGRGSVGRRHERECGRRQWGGGEDSWEESRGRRRKEGKRRGEKEVWEEDGTRGGRKGKKGKRKKEGKRRRKKWELG